MIGGDAFPALEYVPIRFGTGLARLRRGRHCDWSGALVPCSSIGRSRVTPAEAAAAHQYRRAVPSSMIACTSVTVSDGFACATIASTKDGTFDRFGQCSGLQSLDRTMHFGQCMNASSSVTMRTRLGSLPLTASRVCKELSRTILPVPLTRNVSPLPGIKKNSATSGYESKFSNVSSRWFLDGQELQPSSRPKPQRNRGGSPLGESSIRASAPLKATITKGQAAMNLRQTSST